ncbi:hypothetical protein GA069_16100 [Vibrio parahaemolyticus]|nr:hypothetical protein [Vibrio parahaemolyticus]EMC9391333.1 hypothetical protein [Vibrio parahaemolyticus]
MDNKNPLVSHRYFFVSACYTADLKISLKAQLSLFTPYSVNPMKHTLKKTFHVISLVLAALIFVAAGQIAQYITSVKELRQQTLLNWQTHHPDQQANIQQFIDTCLTPKTKHKDDVIKALDESEPTVLLTECGKRIGATELVNAITKSDAQLQQLAWPLSYLEN